MSSAPSRQSSELWLLGSARPNSSAVPCLDLQTANFLYSQGNLPRLKQWGNVDLETASVHIYDAVRASPNLAHEDDMYRKNESPSEDSESSAVDEFYDLASDDLEAATVTDIDVGHGEYCNVAGSVGGYSCTNELRHRSPYPVLMDSLSDASYPVHSRKHEDAMKIGHEQHDLSAAQSPPPQVLRANKKVTFGSASAFQPIDLAEQEAFQPVDLAEQETSNDSPTPSLVPFSHIVPIHRGTFSKHAKPINPMLPDVERVKPPADIPEYVGEFKQKSSVHRNEDNMSPSTHAAKQILQHLGIAK